MDLITSILAFLFSLSLFGNGALFYKIKKLRTQPKPTYDVNALMHYLTKGPAILKMEVIDPAGLFLRAPRDL